MAAAPAGDHFDENDLNLRANYENYASFHGNPITLKGILFGKDIGLAANRTIVYNLNGNRMIRHCDWRPTAINGCVPVHHLDNVRIGAINAHDPHLPLIGAMLRISLLAPLTISPVHFIAQAERDPFAVW